MTTDELIGRLANHRTIGRAPREELAWIATHGRFRRLQAGEVVLRRGDVVNDLVILLTGRLSFFLLLGPGHRRILDVQAGEAGGLLPYSRMRISGGDVVADEPSEAVTVAREHLPALIRACPEVTEILVHVMTDRTRHFTSTELRNEKLISLGKLAAGLAHELNNPASVVVRNAKSLVAALKSAREAAHVLGRAGLTGSQIAELEDVQNFCMEGALHQMASGLALTDREEVIAGWLSAHELPADLAGELAGTSITREAMDRVARNLRGPELNAAFRWIAAECAAQALSLDIERAASRIHALIATVRGFTNVDTAPDEGPIDIPAGLSDTVALLEGKARTRSVTITLIVASPLPRVHGLSAEINQVWMNLIDNAIDAAPANGHVEVTASHEGPAVVVRVVDDGPGIPPEIQGNIFDPFFTTKATGEGTGLGLDIVRRVVEWHNGQVETLSTPGRTEFVVRLPCMEGDLQRPQASP